MYQCFAETSCDFETRFDFFKLTFLILKTWNYVKNNNWSMSWLKPEDYLDVILKSHVRPDKENEQRFEKERKRFGWALCRELPVRTNDSEFTLTFFFQITLHKVHETTRSRTGFMFDEHFIISAEEETMYFSLCFVFMPCFFFLNKDKWRVW